MRQCPEMPPALQYAGPRKMGLGGTERSLDGFGRHSLLPDDGSPSRASQSLVIPPKVAGNQGGKINPRSTLGHGAGFLVHLPPSNGSKGDRGAARESGTTMQPSVSIIVPCFNEEATIGSLLEAIHEQTYPRNRVEVVIADGLSEDGTRAAVAGFRRRHPELAVRVIDNPKRTIPAGLNLAIREARGEILVRLDAHSAPIPEYVERCVRDLELGRGSNVGGVWAIAPGGQGWIPEGIAAAAGHPMGAGDALYRLGGEARPVDTVPFGAFRRTLIADVGEFDESLLTNEDYEFNVRIRRHGGVVWMDPEIQSTYVARPTLTALARQYWRYGYWKLRMLSRYPGSLRWRQAMPALFVLSVMSLAVVALAWRPAVIMLAGILLIYLIVLTAAGIQIGLRHGKSSLIPGSILAFGTMHLAWGAGFWTSMVRKGLRRNG